jgi:hypothetical protein
MPFLVKVTVDDHLIAVPATTAKEAFATAVEWQDAKQLQGVLISDGSKNYSIAEFSAKMALAEITVTRRSFDSF